MPADYHVHTFLCKHAEGSLPEYVSFAREKSIPEICFTDHIPTPHSYDVECRMTLEQFPSYKDLVSEARDSDDPTILFGVEADYYDGCERFLDEWIPAQGFDLVIGSVHYIGDWGFDNPKNLKVWDSVDVAGVWREYFRILDRLVGTGFFDVVGHLDLPKKFGHRPRDRVVREMAKPLLDRIALSGTGIEVNTAGLRKTVGEMYPSAFLLELARDREIPICFGSDAHQPHEVGYAFDKAMDLARAVGYENCLRFRRGRKELIPLT